MTAINVAVQRDRLHVLTDSAHYFSNGVLYGFAPKAFPVPSWPGIVAARGPSFAAPILGQALAITFRSFDALVEGVSKALPDMLRLMPAMDDPNLSPVELILAGYSKSRDEMESYLIRTSRALPPGMTDDEMEALREREQIIEPDAFELIRLPQVAVAPLPDACDLEDAGLDGVDPDDGPEKVIRGLRLCIEIQRHMTPGGYYSVGGAGQLMTLDKNGITTRELCRWDDQIGEPITPEPIDWKAWHAQHGALANVDLTSLSRLQRERMLKKARKGTLG